MAKKIAVLGTGANGSCTAADLTRAGLDVVLIDQWPAHVEAMRLNGLTIEMPDETLHVPVRAHHLCDLAGLKTTFDLVFLMTKAYDTRWHAELIKPYLAPDGLLVGIQNSMTTPDIAEIVGPSRTIGCVIELSSEVFTPAKIQRNTPPSNTWFGLGALDPSMEGRVAEVAEVLRHAGKVEVMSDILSAKWMKLIVNVMCLGPFAMLGLGVADAAKMPGMRELVVRIGTEALEAGQDLGYKTLPIFGMRPDEIRGSNRMLENLLDRIVHDLGPRARDCVLQDHLKGRYSEVDVINGMVADEMLSRGKSAPANAAVVEITRQIRAGTLTPDPSNLDLVQRMLAN